MRSPVTLNRAEAMLRDELGKLGVHRVLVTVGNGAAAVYFTLKGKSLVMASDRFDTDAANLRSIGLAVGAMRTLERHGGGAMLDRAFAGFAALPSPQSCWETLGVQPDAGKEAIDHSFRIKALERHPDRGGSHEAMAELIDARDRALASDHG